jgi:hypothetical protein
MGDLWGLTWAIWTNAQLANQTVVSASLSEQSRLRNLAGVWHQKRVCGLTGGCP